MSVPGGSSSTRRLETPTLATTCLTSGRVRPKARERGARRYLPGGWSRGTLPVNAFLVEHPRGLCLFDTGQSARAARPGYLPVWHPYLRLARFELTAADEVAAQLGRLGHHPQDVAVVVLSHLHTDHAGTVDAFPGAEVLASRTEWQRASGLGGRLRGYLPQHWPADVAPRLVDFGGPPRGPFGATHDVFSDGALLLVPLPGHTDGHLGLLVDVAPRALLAGDLVHDPRELRLVAPAVEAFCTEEDVALLCAHDERPPVPDGATGHHHQGV